MNLINKLIILFLLSGFYAPSFAAVDDVEMTSCSTFSEGDGKKEGETEEEEEPDCE